MSLYSQNAHFVCMFFKRLQGIKDGEYIDGDKDGELQTPFQ